MYATSHQPMRGRRVVTDQGCIRVRPRQHRRTDRDRAIAESAGIR